MLEDPSWKSAPFHLCTDASGSFFCKAWSGHSRFQHFLPKCFKQQSIAVKELLPIVMACMVWGKTLSKYAVIIHCDNQVVVELINAGYCKDSHLMQLLWCLFSFQNLYHVVQYFRHWTPSSSRVLLGWKLCMQSC